MKFTKTSIAEIENPDKQIDYHDSEIGGLILRVFPSGIKSFRLRYTIGNKRKIYTIGKLGSITLTQAKKEAQRLIGARLYSQCL